MDRKDNEYRQSIQHFRDQISDKNITIMIQWIVMVILCLIILFQSCRAQAAPDWNYKDDYSLVKKVSDTASFIHKTNPNLEDPITPAEYLVRASYEAGLTYPANYELLTAIAYWETGRTFDIYARGDAGERGLLQLHPCHDDAVIAAGLNPNDSYHQVLYGALMIKWNTDIHGMSLYQALSPWTTRDLAWNTVKKIRRHND